MTRNSWLEFLILHLFICVPWCVYSCHKTILIFWLGSLNLFANSFVFLWQYNGHKVQSFSNSTLHICLCFLQSCPHFYIWSYAPICLGSTHVRLFSDIIIKSAFFQSQFDLRNLQNPYIFAIKTAPPQRTTSDDFCKPKGRGLFVCLLT